MRWLTLGLTLTAVALAACGDDGDDEAAATSTPTSAAEPAADVISGEEKIVVKTYADLESVVDTGDVLNGSHVGASPFCPKGTFSGGHGNTENGWLDKTFECQDGTLTIAFDPRNMKPRSASGPWEVLSGTGAYEGMKGGGEMKIRFPADPQALEGRETFIGTVSQ